MAQAAARRPHAAVSLTHLDLRDLPGIGARTEEQLHQNLGAVGWNLTPSQVAKLDAASALTPAYPYWHQRGFAERNPPPVG